MDPSAQQPAPDLPGRPARRRPFAMLTALGLSAALHLLVLAALGSILVPRARPTRPIELVLVEEPAATPPAAAAPAPRPPAPGARTRALTHGTQPAARAEGPRSAQPPSGEVAPLSSPPDLVAEGLAPQGDAAAPPARPVPDLRPRLFPAPPPPPASGGAEAASGSGPLAGWAADLAGRARAGSGLAHPYYADVGKALARLWDADRVVRSRGVAGYVADLGRSTKEFVRSWAAMADDYGRTGQVAVLDGGSERLRELAGLPPGPAQDVLVQAEVLRNLRRAWSHGHVTAVRVVQGADGALRSVRLVAPSVDPEVDREALEAVRSAVASLGPPPPEALGGRDALTTVWEFELEVSITPPVPLVTLEFDEALGLGDVRAPLDRRIWKRVRLVALD